MVANNSINLTSSSGMVGYDGAGNFTTSASAPANVLIGGLTANVTLNVAPPNNIGTPLISNGTTGSLPVFGTAQVRGGGTGLATLTAYELMAAGTSTTGVMQQIGLGTSGEVLTSNGAGTLATYQLAPGLYVWTDQSSNFTAVVNNGYFCSSALIATLPATPTQGQSVAIYCDTAGTIVIQANTGQFIRNNSSISSSAGTATNSAQGDTMTLVYRSADTTWCSTSVEGTWTVV